MIDEVLALLGIVMDGQNIGFPKREAADVLSEVDEFLEGHTIGRSFVVGCEELFFVVDFVDMLPAAARKWLEDGRAADEVEKSIPVHGIFEVMKRFRSDVHIAGISLLRQQNGPRDGDPEFRGDGVVKNC
jgi:hypothetical protein